MRWSLLPLVGISWSLLKIGFLPTTIFLFLISVLIIVSLISLVGFCKKQPTKPTSTNQTNSIKEYERIEMKPIKQIKQFFVLTLFAILSVLVMSSPCWATTYYVDATNGNDSNTGTSEALPWKTIAKVNASNFQPGDFILFKRGEIWREQLNVPSSGAPGNPITIGAYGRGDKPQINGANLITSIWVEVENNVWQTSLKTDPRSVIFDDVYGKPQTLLSSLSADEDWYWSDDLDKLYVYSDSDPNGRNIEGYFYTFNLNIDGKDYITVQNIKFRVSGWNNIYIEGDADNITLDGVTTNHSYIAGVQANTGDTEQINDLTIQNSTFAYAGKIGLDVVEVVDCLISTNAVHHNNLRGISTTHGIRVSQNVESTYYPTNVTSENNTFLYEWIFCRWYGSKCKSYRWKRNPCR